MGEVERIAKTGRNDFHKYDYATEADITAAVREHMAKRHLLLVPSVEKTEWEKMVSQKGVEKKICTLTVRYTIHDGDSGEDMQFTVLGQGEDSSDKATYKALTGATKYALLKLFLIPTGDDPEQDGEHRHTPGRSAPQGNRPPLPTPQQVLGVAPASGPIRDETTKVKYGKAAGKFLCDIDDAQLAWVLEAAKKAVDGNDPKWHTRNKAWLATVQAETARRINDSQQDAGRRQTPPQSSPRLVREEPRVEPTSEGEPIVTPYMRMIQLGRMHGLTPAQVAGRAEGVTGKKSGWTAADVEAVAGALGALK
jgi:hypothetical protein